MERVAPQEIKIFESLKTKIRTNIKIEDEISTVTRRINSVETGVVDTVLPVFPEGYEVRKSERSSEFSESELQSNDDVSLSLRCRLCAIPNNDMVDVFSSSAIEDNIVDKIEHCLCIVVRESDTLPKRVCLLCLQKLELCYSFNETVAEAEKQLLAFERLASGILEQAEIFPLETSNNKSTTSPKKVQTIDTTVRRNVLLSSLKPCSVVLTPIEISSKKNVGTNSGGKSSSVSLNRNTNSTVATFDSGRITKSKIHYWSTCDSEVTGAIRHTSNVADAIKISNRQSEKEVEHQENLVTGEQAHAREILYYCNSCPKFFKTKGHLTQHSKLHTGTGLHSCEYCERKFTCETYRDRHHIIHTKRSQCSICKKTFKSHYATKRHATMHYENRDYPCSLCDKSFKLLDRLKRHMLIHTGLRPWQCTYCKHNFRRRYQLTRHLPICEEQHRRKLLQDVIVLP